MTPEDWKYVTTIQPPYPPDYVSLFATGEEPVEQIFRKALCVACHIIPGIPDATGALGPALNMKLMAPLRLKDPKYSGKATTVREYIRESIINPSTYVITLFPDNTMPKVYGQKLPAIAVEKMVDYLAEVEENKVPTLIK